MTSLENFLGIYDCEDCGKKLYWVGINRCQGEDIDHNRTVICEDIICNDCMYKVVIKNDDGEIIEVQRYCKFHVEKYLLDWTLKELKELRYHGSFKDEDEDLVSVRCKDCEELLEEIIRKKKKIIKKRRKKSREEKLKLAINYQKAGRYKESAELYEELEMWEKAGKVRKKNKEKITKLIHIDANDLFRQIKKEGLAIPYKCPNCSGTLKIDGKKSINECPYCGSDIDIETLSNLVDTLL